MKRSKKRQRVHSVPPPPKAPEPAPEVAPAGLTRYVPWVLIALILPLVFLLPYHVPMQGPTTSQSWEFGFNNTAAQGLMALLLLVLFGWYLIIQKGLPSSPVLRVITGPDRSGSNRNLLIAMVMMMVVASVILNTWYNILPYSHYGEITYFVQRLEAMAMGRAPYKDFSFDYGPWMLAFPFWLYQITDAGLSVEQVYLVTLLLHFVLGYVVLAYVVSRLNLGGRKVWIFLLIAIPLMNLTMGLNYTPLRFCIAPASLFAVRHLYLLTRKKQGGFPWVLAVAAFALPIVNFAISPEMGLAVTLSLVVYFVWFLFSSERLLTLLALPVLGGVALTAVLFPRTYFDSMLGFGKGGGSFPIFPTIPIVCFLAAALWVLPRLGLIAVRDRTGAAPFCASLAILMGLLILPTLGRCDLGHVFLNSIPLFLVALAAVTWLAPKWQTSIMGVFFAIFTLINWVCFWQDYHDSIANVMDIRQQLSGMNYTADNFEDLPPGAPRPPVHYSKLLPIAKWFEQLPQAKIGIPMGVNESLERYLILSGRYAPEFHIAPYGDIFEPSQLPSKYKDFPSMPYMLIPDNYFGYLQKYDPAQFMKEVGESDCKFMSSLLLFPVNLQPVHPLYKAEFDIMRRIAQEYDMAERTPGGILLKRKE